MQTAEQQSAWYARNKERVRETQKKYHAANREKISEHFAARYAENPEKDKAIGRMAHAKRKGIDLSVVRDRPAQCEICNGTNANGRVMHLDHDHNTGEFRGWLCQRCNSALGFARNDPELLEKLAAYLRSYHGR